MNIFSILPTGHIVIGFCRTLKMCPIVCPLGTLESDGWAHSKCTQHVPTGHIWVIQQGIFKMYSGFDHWAYWSQMLTAISMFSPCTQWVFGPLSPVILVLTHRTHYGKTQENRSAKARGGHPRIPQSPGVREHLGLRLRRQTFLWQRRPGRHPSSISDTVCCDPTPRSPTDSVSVRVSLLREWTK